MSVISTSFITCFVASAFGKSFEMFVANLTVPIVPLSNVRSML